jgi:phenylpropionate dioxygenase-like ring-hydroxylating dioxygenase large terminal subunit
MPDRAGDTDGELLRRYWHPIAGAGEFAQRTVKPVRILGEDLTLYRDKSRDSAAASVGLSAGD